MNASYTKTSSCPALSDGHKCFCCLSTRYPSFGMQNLLAFLHECYINGSKTNSCGVAILLNNSFKKYAFKVAKDDDAIFKDFYKLQ